MVSSLESEKKENSSFEEEEFEGIDPEELLESFGE
jgi:hypothetical protein